MYAIGIIIVGYFYVRLAMWTARKAARQYESKQGKWGAKVAVALVFILVPFGDSIVGQIYFNHLCETEAGAKVYQTIELPAEYWDEGGKPKFYVNWDANLGKKYPLIYTSGTFSPLFHIDNAGYKFIDKKSDELLGELVNFRYWGGWVKRSFSPHNTAISCDVTGKIINDIFIPEH